MKQAGAKANLDIALSDSFLLNINKAITNPIVIPTPPIFTNTSKNGLVTMFGITWLASKAFIFSSIAVSNVGSVIGLNTKAPCNPKLHNKPWSITTIIIPGSPWNTALIGVWITLVIISYTSIPVNFIVKNEINPNIVSVNVAGISKLKLLDTVGGTESGILIFKALDFWNNLKSSVDNIEAIIATNNPVGDVNVLEKAPTVSPPTVIAPGINATVDATPTNPVPIPSIS